MTSCLICGGTDHVTVYRGRIREGRFGELSTEPHDIFECRSCGVRALRDERLARGQFYQSDSYRERVDGAADAASYFRIHDVEQLRHLTATGTGAFRDRVVADVGCGGGSFLHCIEGMAETIVAIEPSETFRRSLQNRGYMTFAYAADATPQMAGRVDVAVSFSVIEHVEDPAQFLADIRQLLRSNGGQLIVSTPNADDALLSVLPADYPQFFYRRAHLWYWTPDAFKRLLLRAGFGDVTVTPFQRYGFGNFIAWLRDRSPQGEKRFDIATLAVDAVWKSEIQRLGRSDYLFATART